MLCPPHTLGYPLTITSLTLPPKTSSVRLACMRLIHSFDAIDRRSLWIGSLIIVKSTMSGSGCLGLLDLSKISLESKFKDNDQTLRNGNLEAAERRQKEIALKIRILGGLALASLLALAAMPAAHADEFDQATLLKFRQAVRIPGPGFARGILLVQDHRPWERSWSRADIKSDRTTLVGTL